MTGHPLTPTRGAPRILRGTLLAGTSAALAVAAHTIGGGMLPDPALTVLLTVGVAAAGIALADRRRGPVAILAALGGSHLGIHLMLSLVATGQPGQMINPVAMAGGHVVAVLLAAVLLSKAESACFAVCSALAALLALLLPHWLVEPPAPVPEKPALRVLAAPPTDRPLDVLLRRACARRGPPPALAGR